MPSLTLLDCRDLPEVRRRRGQLYLAAFCAVGLCFQATATTRTQSDGVLDGFFLLLGLLGVTTGSLALVLLRKSRVGVASGKWARTQPSRGRRAATAHLLPRDLAHSAFRHLLLIASFVEKRLIPVMLHILASSLSFLHSRARRRFSDGGPVEESDETMENLAVWRSTRLRRPAAVQFDVPMVSPTKGEASRAPPRPAEPVATSTPLPKHDPWSKMLEDFEERSKRGTRRNR